MPPPGSSLILYPKTYKKSTLLGSKSKKCCMFWDSTKSRKIHSKEIHSNCRKAPPKTNKSFQSFIFICEMRISEISRLSKRRQLSVSPAYPNGLMLPYHTSEPSITAHRRCNSLRVSTATPPFSVYRFDRSPFHRPTPASRPSPQVFPTVHYKCAKILLPALRRATD